MKNPEMLEALSALAIEKGISEEIMLEALANALVTAYKRMPDAAEEALAVERSSTVRHALTEIRSRVVQGTISRDDAARQIV